MAGIAWLLCQRRRHEDEVLFLLRSEERNLVGLHHKKEKEIISQKKKKPRKTEIWRDTNKSSASFNSTNYFQTKSISALRSVWEVICSKFE